MRRGSSRRGESSLRSAGDICQFFAASAWHRTVLETVRALDLPDWWIGAGFVRSAVWDHLHGFATPTPLDDIDVIWFDTRHPDRDFDETLVAKLRAQRPDLPWSVKNQARMPRRNGDRPYRSSFDAMRHWPETATAVAITLRDSDVLEFAAPFGIDDLLTLMVRPTPHFRANRVVAYDERQRAKNWRARWPRLREWEKERVPVAREQEERGFGDEAS
jgi:uncharacterized protein